MKDHSHNGSWIMTQRSLYFIARQSQLTTLMENLILKIFSRVLNNFYLPLYLDLARLKVMHQARSGIILSCESRVLLLKKKQKPPYVYSGVENLEITCLLSIISAFLPSS